MPVPDPATLWTGRGLGARVTRAVLAPLGWGFAAGVAVKNRLYDAGVVAPRPTAVPAVSVGNLSVGGTGKTPVAADLARRLLREGARPGIVLRGYGEDEPAVHAILNPDVPVIVNADRVAGSVEAHRLGCDVVVLDDAFQHRRAARVADIVLVAAEQWAGTRRPLPAGPYRESVASLARASLVLVTRKSAPEQESVRCAESIARDVPVPVVRASLTLGDLVRVSAEAPCEGTGPLATARAGDPDRRSLEALRGTRVLAVAGIGAPQAFAAQLEAAGASVELVSFPDHHRFGEDDVRLLVRRATRHQFVVCTLKDAVKLAGQWPRDGSPLWYVSQRLRLEAGEEAYAACMRLVLDARATPQLPHA